MKPDQILKKVFRKIGSDAAARGKSITWTLSLGTSETQREFLRQGHDMWMARHSDRRAA